MTFRIKFCAIAFAILGPGLQNVLADILLLSDDFNRTAGVLAAGNAGGNSSWGINNNALGGTINQTYKVRDTAAGTSTEQQYVDGNFGRLRLGHGVVNHDLLTNPLVLQNGYKVSFDFQRGGGGYVAFALGLTPNEIQTHPQNNARIGVPFAANIPETDFGFLFRPAAATEIWKAGVNQGAGPVSIFNAASMTPSVTSLANNALIEITPAVAGQWGSGSTINISVNVNNAAVPQYSTTFTSDGSGLGYFGFHSNAGASVQHAAIDNVRISTIPEPGSTALLLIACVATGLRRRARK